MNICLRALGSIPNTEKKKKANRVLDDAKKLVLIFLGVGMVL
jgi:hypothetical protein